MPARAEAFSRLFKGQLQKVVFNIDLIETELGVPPPRDPYAGMSHTAKILWRLEELMEAIVGIEYNAQDKRVLYKFPEDDLRSLEAQLRGAKKRIAGLERRVDARWLGLPI